MRVAIAGCGHVATAHHLPAIAALPDVVAVAVADPDRDRRRAAMSAFGIERGYADAGEMLDASDDVDLVAVVTSPEAHAEIGLAALRRGLGVLVEKPLALQLDDADELVRTAETTGRVAACGFNLRSHRLVEEARSVVGSGELGSIRVVRSVLTAPSRMRPRLPAWRRRGECGGGALFEMGVHHVDLWRHLLGREVVRVVALAGDEPLPEETVALTAWLEGDIVASSVFCQGTATSHAIEVFGDEACLRLSLYRADGLEVIRTKSPPGGVGARIADGRRMLGNLWSHRAAIRRGGLYLDSFRRHWAGVAAAVRDRQAPPSTLDDGRQALRVLLAARRSTRSGRLEAP